MFREKSNATTSSCRRRRTVAQRLINLKESEDLVSKSSQIHQDIDLPSTSKAADYTEGLNDMGDHEAVTRKLKQLLNFDNDECLYERNMNKQKGTFYANKKPFYTDKQAQNRSSFDPAGGDGDSSNSCLDYIPVHVSKLKLYSTTFDLIL